MTAHVVFADPPLPAPTPCDAPGLLWQVDSGVGAWVWLHDGRIETPRGVWSPRVAERMDLAMRAASRAATAEWSEL